MRDPKQRKGSGSELTTRPRVEKAPAKSTTGRASNAGSAVSGARRHLTELASLETAGGRVSIIHDSGTGTEVLIVYGTGIHRLRQPRQRSKVYDELGFARKSTGHVESPGKYDA